MDQSILSTRDIIGQYFARMESNPGLSWLSQVSDLFISTQPSEVYPFIGQAPTMREWVGGRQPKSLWNAARLEIDNQHYEATLEVDVRDARRAKSDQLKVRIEEFADRSLSHWASLVTYLLSISETAHSYDGVPFFSTTHSEGASGLQSNLISVDISELDAQLHGVPAAPSIEEVQQVVGQAVTQIMTMKDDRGEIFNDQARKFLVLAPVNYAFVVQSAFNQAQLGALPGNRNLNVIESDGRPFEISVATSSRLGWTDKLAVFRTDGNTKALIRQSETDIQLRAKGEGSEHEFDTDTWQFGVDAWRGAWFGHWQRACLVRLV